MLEQKQKEKVGQLDQKKMGRKIKGRRIERARQKTAGRVRDASSLLASSESFCIPHSRKTLTHV